MSPIVTPSHRPVLNESLARSTGGGRRAMAGTAEAATRSAEKASLGGGIAHAEQRIPTVLDEVLQEADVIATARGTQAGRRP
jgi:hypothetical protein